MKVVLAIENSKGKNTYFIADDGKVYSAGDAVALARSGQIDDVRVATRNGVPYLRTNRKRNTQFTLQEITVAETLLLRTATNTSNFLSQPAYRPYWAWYQKYLENQAQNGVVRIAVDGYYFSTDAHVRETLAPLKEYVFGAGQRFSVDPYLLGGILVDEIVRFAPFEEITDKLQLRALKINVSVGVAQVKLDTAKDLIQAGYFNPNTDDPQLDKDVIKKTPRSHLYQYLVDQRNNVYFGAATIRTIVDSWKAKVGIDLTPELIGSLYSLGRTPHANPVANDRGLQIAQEFLPLAHEILDSL